MSVLRSRGGWSDPRIYIITLYNKVGSSSAVEVEDHSIYIVVSTMVGNVQKNIYQPIHPFHTRNLWSQQQVPQLILSPTSTKIMLEHNHGDYG